MKKLYLLVTMIILCSAFVYGYDTSDEGKIIVFRKGINKAIDSIIIDDDLYVSLEQILDMQGEEYLMESNVVQIIRKDKVIEDKYYYSNGDIHVGKIIDGVKENIGVTYIYDGGRIEGEFKDGKLNGTGKRILVSGDYYEGNFEDGFFNGYGEYHFVNGDVYKGNWIYGVRTGYGTMYYDNGYAYKGEWHDNIHHGYGYYRKESMKQGKWDEGEYRGYLSDDKINERLDTYK